MRVLVTGAGGFIGHHLTKYLVELGCWVRGVDRKYPEYEGTSAQEFVQVDLRDYRECCSVVNGMEEVYHLAADMGGIGYITQYHAEIAHNNVMMDAFMLKASHEANVPRFFYASSACVYPAFRQQDAVLSGLREEEAIPADPEPGYGWEKLFAEQLCGYYRRDYEMQTRIARFHNVYGPLGTYDGGKEKAPAALCRKVAQAQDGDAIEIWGDGRQTRSFVYIEDCVVGIHRLMQSACNKPLNLGSSRLISIADLAQLIIRISGKNLHVEFDPARPQGVRGRNSNNALIKSVLWWEPRIPLEDGLKTTYAWIAAMLIDPSQRLHQS